VSELDAILLGACQDGHGITIDQVDLGEVDSQDTVFLQRSTKDIHAFPGNPTTDTKNDTLFIRKPVDSAGHGRVAFARCASLANRRPPAVPRKCSKTDVRPDWDPANLVDLEDLEDLASFSGT
jgi:hypothetical protein